MRSLPIRGDTPRYASGFTISRSSNETRLVTGWRETFISSGAPRSPLDAPGLLGVAEPAAGGLGEDHLAQADAGRRHLDALILGDELERLLERDRARRGEPHGVVGRRRPHVGELLLLGGVHVHLLGAGVLADDHPLVHLDAGAEEELASLLQAEERETARLAAPVGAHRAVRPGLQLAEPRLVTLEHMVEDARAAGLGHELGPEADEPTGRHDVLHADPPRTVVHHLIEAPLAEREELGDDSEVVVGHVDGDPFDGLVHLAVDLSSDDLGLADRQLEALSPHRLHEHRELELAPALDLPRVGPLRRQDAPVSYTHLR